MQRIDPATNAVTATIRVGTQPVSPTGSARSGSPTSAPARSSASTRRRTASCGVIRVGGQPGGLAISRSAVWVGNLPSRQSPHQLRRNQVVKRVRVGSKPVRLAAKGVSRLRVLADPRAAAGRRAQQPAGSADPRNGICSSTAASSPATSGFRTCAEIDLTDIPNEPGQGDDPRRRPLRRPG